MACRLVRPHSLRLSSFFYGMIFLLASTSGVSFADSITFKKVADISIHKAISTVVVVKNDRLFTGDENGTLAASSVDDGKLFWSQQFRVDGRIPDAITAIAVSFTGDLIVVATKSGSMCTLSTESGGGMTCWKPQSLAKITAMDLASDGIFLVTGDENGTLLRWNILSQESEVLGIHDYPIITVRFRTDDNVLAGDGKKLILWNMRERREEQVILSAGENTEGAFWFDFLGYSSDLSQVVGCSGDSVSVFELSTSKLLAKITKEPGAATLKSATLVDDMSEIITTDVVGGLTVWDTATLKPKSARMSLQFGFISYFVPLTKQGYFAIAGTYVSFPFGFVPGVSIWDYN